MWIFYKKQAITCYYNCPKSTERGWSWHKVSFCLVEDQDTRSRCHAVSDRQYWYLIPRILDTLSWWQYYDNVIPFWPENRVTRRIFCPKKFLCSCQYFFLFRQINKTGSLIFNCQRVICKGDNWLIIGIVEGLKKNVTITLCWRV